jgi:hypothetical protein
MGGCRKSFASVTIFLHGRPNLQLTGRGLQRAATPARFARPRHRSAGHVLAELPRWDLLHPSPLCLSGPPPVEGTSGLLDRRHRVLDAQSEGGTSTHYVPLGLSERGAASTSEGWREA